MTPIKLRSLLFVVSLMGLTVFIGKLIKENQFFTIYLPQPTLKIPNQYELYVNETLKEENLTEIYRSSGEENIKKRLPTALIIGVKKGGTGALHAMLNMHPDIVVAQEEPQFFTKHYGDGNLERYKNMMPYSHPNQVTIDSSAGYFIVDDALKRIRRFNSTIRMILIIRDPITRFISDYTHMRARRLENFHKISIDDFVQKKEHRRRFEQLINSSYYRRHFARFLKYFPRHQIHVVDGNKFIKKNPAKELRKVETFLKVAHYLREDRFTFSPSKGFYCFVEDGEESCMGSDKGRIHPNISSQSLEILENLLKKEKNSVAELCASNAIQD